jgi:hypothetical protein
MTKLSSITNQPTSKIVQSLKSFYNNQNFNINQSHCLTQASTFDEPNHNPENSQDTASSSQDNYSGQVSLQQVITPIKDNSPFGDFIPTNKPKNTIRLLFKNVNGIHKAKSWTELQNLSQQLENWNIDMFGAAETNIKWNYARNQQARRALQKHSRNCVLHTSSNSEDSFSGYQPGGTLTTIRNELAGRIASIIHDKTNLGRWSGFKLHTNFHHKLNIITVYQSTKSEGIHTT